MLFNGVTQLKRSTLLGYTAPLTFSKITIINEMSLVFHNTTLTSPREYETAASTVKHMLRREPHLASDPRIGTYRESSCRDLPPLKNSFLFFSTMDSTRAFTISTDVGKLVCVTQVSLSGWSSPASAEREGSESRLSTHSCWSFRKWCLSDY